MGRETKEARKERQAEDELQFVYCLRMAGNTVTPEHRVCADRKWRVDYLIHSPLAKGAGVIALEIQGFGFGHVGRAGWLRDIDKAQAIAANGWLYCPVTRDQISNGDALEALARCGVNVDRRIRQVYGPRIDGFQWYDREGGESTGEERGKK